MFCSWKSGIDAPCGCAFHLRRPIAELLNHLSLLGQGTLILRRPGLSLAKSTPFGLHVSARENGWNFLHDAVSGLETNLVLPQNAYLLREMSDSCPLFAMGPPGKPIELTIRLTEHAWHSAAIRGMITKLDGLPLDCIESRRLGAGAWLDEWEQAASPISRSSAELIQRSGDALQRCQKLQVEIRTSSQRSAVCFQPSFIDSEGSVLRIADKTRTHIVYADVNASGFSLAADGPRNLQLTHSAS